MSEPIVPVSMAVKNAHATVKMCIDSLESQNLDQEFEIVVVSSMSTDGTRDILEEKARMNPRTTLACLEVARESASTLTGFTRQGQFSPILMAWSSLSSLESMTKENS
jgi:glycosyltransferase involved in cell wall biosynthesis